MADWSGRVRCIARCFVSFVLVLAAVVMVQVDRVDAQEAPSCSQGVLEGNVFCLITGDAPTPGQVCPVSRSVVELNGECISYRRTVPVTCTAPYQPILEGSCVYDVGYVLNSPGCAGAPGGVGYSNTENELGPTSVCEQRPPAGEATCPPNTVDLDGVLCKQTVALVDGLICAADFSLSGGDTCLRRVIADGLSASCPVGELVETLCREVGPAPSITGPYCDLQGSSIMRFGGCFIIEPLSGQLGSCPFPTIPLPDGVNCAQLVALDPNVPCRAGSLVSDGICYELLDPSLEPIPTCANDGVYDEASFQCIVTGSAPFEREELTCPDGDPYSWFLDDICRVFVEPVIEAGQQVCPGGSSWHLEGVICAESSPTVLATVFCDRGFEQVGAACLRYEFPTGTPGQCYPGGYIELPSGECALAVDIEGCTEVFYYTDCVVITPVPGAECTVDQILDVSPFDSTLRCLQPVPAVPSQLLCPSGFDVDNGECARFSAPEGLPAFDCFPGGIVDPDCIGRILLGPGDTIIPGLPEIQIPVPVALRPVQVQWIQCAGGGAVYGLRNQAGAIVASGDLTESTSQPGSYEAVVVPPESGQVIFEFDVTCPSGEDRASNVSVTFTEPAGLVVDCVGDFVNDAVLTLSRADNAAGPFVTVASGDTAILTGSQLTNPTVSDANGLYRWRVSGAGFYTVTAQVAGQPSIQSAVLEIPDAQPWVNFVFRQLNCIGAPCSASFADVGDDYFTDAVDWAACTGVSSGTSATAFSPTGVVTRAQLATFLWRFAGEPTGFTHPFVDVVSPSYYEDAVAWMAATGITAGKTDTTFAPDEPVTRAQLATFLWRFADEPSGFTHPFVDVVSPSYYEDAVAWMAATEITNGTTDTTFTPNAPLTRAQAVTFLWRFAGEP